MFNHESEFRGDQYLVMKIINFALKVKTHKKEVLKIGSLDLIRDWGYAGDVAEAIYKINIENELKKRKIDADIIKTLNQLFNNCEMARYTPITNVEMESDYKTALEIISKIDKSIN